LDPHIKEELSGSLSVAETDVACTIFVRNVSEYSVTIAKTPFNEFFPWSGGIHPVRIGGSVTGNQQQFVTLKPGESIEYEAVLPAKSLATRSAKSRLNIGYWKLADTEDAWMGNVGYDDAIASVR
jgi:hypothetical protein